MISDHFNDKTTYKMVESNCDAKVMKGIAKIIEKYKDNLTKKEEEYLINFSYKTSNFYGLPKIHKSKLKTTKRAWTYYRTIRFKTKTNSSWTYLSEKTIE